MLLTHVYLIMTGRTTVESFKGRDQDEQEALVLQLEYGHLWHNQQKRKVKRRWEEEWGGVPVDARWRWGSAGQLWMEEMGKTRLGWLCK
jgi:palmitoyltransferase